MVKPVSELPDNLFQFERGERYKEPKLLLAA